MFFALIRFPKDKDMRKKWEVALRREGFTASESSVICSEHFKQDEFDRTGQIDSEMARLNEALARVESLERERKNAMAREKRAKTTVRSLLGDLREKNLINEELKERLDFYSDLQIDFKAKQGHEYSKDHREWLCSVDGKPGLNKMMLDMLERRCQEDQATYGCVALMLDAMAIRKHVSQRQRYEEEVGSCFEEGRVHCKRVIRQINEALARVESLERERKNAMAREKRAKTTVRSLLGDLREKNLINEELKERLDFYSDLQIDFKAKQGHEYSKDHREWLCSVDGKPGLNKMMLDMLERRCQEDQATYGCVALMLDAMAIRKHTDYTEWSG
ncbi:hypothetical protein F7725_019111 [Dissostichus mawsoni]|uniref:THAP-type domain-containing protein n=1 Tax=Dissostichus mawsoni TaxID=36200 RepID=A0A7J5XTE4_DISMA|nr:hypothetical protein F7725_019111 [Dissostichus mawsoni]